MIDAGGWRLDSTLGEGGEYVGVLVKPDTPYATM